MVESSVKFMYLAKCPLFGEIWLDLSRFTVPEFKDKDISISLRLCPVKPGNIKQK